MYPMQSLMAMAGIHIVRFGRAPGGFVSLALLLIGAGCGMGQRAVSLQGLNPPVLKPSGQEFKFWRNQTVFATTYHVDGNSPQASDQNPGTQELPFKTINRAADVLQPGERVLVHAGIYRECIRPARGGSSPSQMIGFHAEDGVIVRGSEPVGNKWVVQEPLRAVWALDLKTVPFGDYNPFTLANLPSSSFDIMDWAKNLRGKLPYTLPRGMVFQDGQRLRRVATRAELLTVDGSYWTDRQAGELFVRPLGGQDPNGLLMEITTRRAGFRPRVRGLGFIQVRGFVFEQVGNGFPRPQEGGISVGAGHHWLIEENTVRQINGIGIDIGDGWYGGAVKPPERGDEDAAWNIVRRNHISDTGVCGIAGMPATNALIEENVLRNNTLYAVEKIYECAGIKTHKNQGTLIRRNLIMDNSVNAIWMDWDNRDTRCTQNVIVNCTTGIFIEASVIKPYCLLDRNIVWGAKQGILEQDSKNQTIVHNFIGHSKAGIIPRGKVSGRFVGLWHPTAGGGHTIANNVFFEVTQEIKQTLKPAFPPNRIAANASEKDGISASLDAQRGILTLRASRPLASPGAQSLVTEDLFDHRWPPEDRSPGPVPLGDGRTVEIRLDWWRER